jgi:hypothetical protein
MPDGSRLAGGQLGSRVLLVAMTARGRCWRRESRRGGGWLAPSRRRPQVHAGSRSFSDGRVSVAPGSSRWQLPFRLASDERVHTGPGSCSPATRSAKSTYGDGSNPRLPSLAHHPPPGSSKPNAATEPAAPSQQQRRWGHTRQRQSANLCVRALVAATAGEQDAEPAVGEVETLIRLAV